MKIKIQGIGKDKDIQALFLLREAIRISTPAMLEANLNFVGLKVSNINRIDQLTK